MLWTFFINTSKLYPKVPTWSNFLLEIDVENRNIFTVPERRCRTEKKHIIIIIIIIIVVSIYYYIHRSAKSLKMIKGVFLILIVWNDFKLYLCKKNIFKNVNSLPIYIYIVANMLGSIIHVRLYIVYIHFTPLPACKYFTHSPPHRLPFLPHPTGRLRAH